MRNVRTNCLESSAGGKVEAEDGDEAPVEEAEESLSEDIAENDSDNSSSNSSDVSYVQPVPPGESLEMDKFSKKTLKS